MKPTYDELVAALADAAFMLAEIERNRAMPSTAATWQQYVAMGRTCADLVYRAQRHEGQQQ